MPYTVIFEWFYEDLIVLPLVQNLLHSTYADVQPNNLQVNTVIHPILYQLKRVTHFLKGHCSC